MFLTKDSSSSDSSPQKLVICMRKNCEFIDQFSLLLKSIGKNTGKSDPRYTAYEDGIPQFLKILSTSWFCWDTSEKNGFELICKVPRLFSSLKVQPKRFSTVNKNKM